VQLPDIRIETTEGAMEYRIAPFLFSTLLLSLGVASNAATSQPPDYIVNAIADPTRPADERAQDINRHPEAVLVFAGVKPGESVVDLLPGRGYYTRIFSKAVGARGKVYALQLEEMDKAGPKGLQSLRTFAGTPDYSNVMVLLQPASALAIPEPVDLIFTSMNYHDLHDSFMGPPDMAKFNRTIFNSLKPGGIYLVLDHVAAAGSGFTKTDDLHRVDPVAVKKEVLAAGFEFVGESQALYNAADDHSLPGYDKTLAGKSDKFVYKFRRPQH
jgi:predicted methyltransferase